VLRQALQVENLPPLDLVRAAAAIKQLIDKETAKEKKSEN